MISRSYYNTVCGNYISGILGFVGSYNIFYGNYMQGILLGNQYMDTPDNIFYENNFDFTGGKDIQVYIGVLKSPNFDNGKVGNYWGDYLIEYPNAAEIDNSGIGDTPYAVYLTQGNNTATHYRYVLSDKYNYTLTLTDNYPLMSPFNISSIQIQLPAWANITVPSLLPSTQASPTPSPTQSFPEFPAVISVITITIMLTATIAIINRQLKRAKEGSYN